MSGVFMSPPAHLAWLVERTSVELTSTFRALETRGTEPELCGYCGELHGRITGMVGYSGWTYSSVSMHVAVDAPACIRTLLRHAFRWPFVEGKKLVVLGITPGDNERALRLNKRIGFKVAHRVKDGWRPGVDLVVHEMRRDECRWL